MVYSPARPCGQGQEEVSSTGIRKVYSAIPCGQRQEEAEEVSSVLDMISRYLLQLRSASASQRGSARRGSLDSCGETDTDTQSTVSDLDSGLELEDRLLQQEVTRRVELCLAEAKASSLQCQVLLLPHHLTARVGRDVVTSSADEPCGLRGASIKVYVDCRDGLRSVGSVLLDGSVTPTFELSVVFRAEKDDGWMSLKLLFESSKVLKLRPEYRLVKRKLYSSASPVVHDFSSG